MNAILDDIEKVASKIRDGFVAVFHAAEHEAMMILSTLVNVYGPRVVATAIATHKVGVIMYADKAIDTAESDVKALVQSTVVEKFGLPPTAAQFIASAIHHLFTIGKDKVGQSDRGGRGGGDYPAAATAITPTCQTAGANVTCQTPIVLTSGTHTIIVTATNAGGSASGTLNYVPPAGPTTPSSLQITIQITVP